MKLKTKIILLVIFNTLIFISISLIFIPFNNFIDFVEINFIKIMISLFIMILLFFVVILIVVNNFFSPIKQIKEILEKINSGSEEINFSSKKNKKDEISAIFTELEKLKNTNSSLKQYISKLNDGVFEINASKNITNNPIGKQLIKVKNFIMSIDTESKDRASKSKKIQWSQTGLTNFSALLQQDFKDITDLATKSIKVLTKYLNVEQGGIFVVHKKKGKDVLVLEASYAYDKKKALDVEFNIGESLVGKCAKEKQLLKFNNLPEGYTFIGSGLGENTPKSLLLIPLIFEKALFGVIEIASLHPIPDYKIYFIQDAGKRIAADISNIKQKLVARKMSDNLKKHAETLIEKEKESLKTISKLKEIQKEIDVQTQKNKAVMDAIISIVSVVFYDLDGKIIDLNQKNEELFQIKKEDYIGKSHFDFLPEAKEDPKWFKQFWEDINNGEKRTKEYYIKKGEHEMWLLETFSLLLDKNGNPEKIINIGVEITEQKRLEQKTQD